MPLTTQKQIALMVETFFTEGPRFLDGILRFVNSKPDWRITVFEGSAQELVPLMREWQGDGILSTCNDREFHAAAAARDIPFVQGPRPALDPGTPSVITDDWQCGQLAADYFRDRGFTRFGFVGSSEAQFSVELAEGFLRRVRKAGFLATAMAAPLGREKELARWLQSQPRPFAIFAASDRSGMRVLEACHLANLNVPEDIAVLGVGDRSQLCELCSPALSSVDGNLESCGFEAAALLSDLMGGERPSNEPRRIAPSGVVARRSSDTYAFEDTELSKALRFIHDNAHQSIKVKDVLAATTISRRSLENRFRRFFSRSLHEEIWRVHFERAKKLLTTTDLGLQDVAERSGFRTASALANLFKQKTGLTPRTYRAKFRR